MERLGRTEIKYKCCPIEEGEFALSKKMVQKRGDGKGGKGGGKEGGRRGKRGLIGDPPGGYSLWGVSLGAALDP